jgi:drug/metabolite transporter (DMT)-like permease
MTPRHKAQLQIHFCVLLWGFTAILGRLISLPAFAIVWWRMLIVVTALALIPQVWRSLRAMPVRLRLAFAGIGILVAMHWLTFYAAIKLANASVAATCIALATVFTALLEPVLAHARFSRRDVTLGIAVLPGVGLVVGGVPDGMRLGVAIGAFSAVLVAVFGSLNKRLVDHADPLAVTALELGAGTLALTAAAPIIAMTRPSSGPLFILPGTGDAALLMALAFACTLLPFALALVALRQMTAFAAQLAVNLEPVYAIVLAIFILGEQRELGALFYVGVVIILGAVLIHPLLSTRPVPDSHTAHAELLATAEAKQLSET